jgi:hypothetical protein
VIAETAIVAGTTYPLTAGATRSSLEDPVAVGLIDYFAHWLNTSLNAQLAVMTGHTATAVPVNDFTALPSEGVHRCAYDPMGTWVRNATPALYVWWKSDRPVNHSTLKDGRVSTYGILYVSDEIIAPAGSQHIAGIAPHVRRVLNLTEDRGYHPTYGYGDDEDGTPIHISLGIHAWRFTRLQAGAMAPVPNVSSAPGGEGEGGVVVYYPAVEGDMEVIEVIGQQIPVDPTDLLVNTTLDIRTNEFGDVTDTVEMLDRYLPAPDGSEQP